MVNWHAKQLKKVHEFTPCKVYTIKQLFKKKKNHIIVVKKEGKKKS